MAESNFKFTPFTAVLIYLGTNLGIILLTKLISGISIEFYSSIYNVSSYVNTA